VKRLIRLEKESSEAKNCCCTSFFCGNISTTLEL